MVRINIDHVSIMKYMIKSVKAAKELLKEVNGLIRMTLELFTYLSLIKFLL